MTLAETHLTTRSIHETPLGPMTATWTHAGLSTLRWDTMDSSAADLSTPRNDRSGLLDDRLAEYFETGSTDFASIELDEHGWTDFTKRVYRCCRAIPPGTKVTYQDLAKMVDSPSASRAVGAAMARNRVLLVIPCHRVVSAGGALRGFSAPGGLQTKQFLLDLESS